MSSPSNEMRPLFGVSSPVIARSVVDFPAPLAPISVTTSPASNRQRHVAQRVDRAVEDVDVLEREHRSSGSAAAKVGLDDLRVLLDLRGRADGDRLRRSR